MAALSIIGQSPRVVIDSIKVANQLVGGLSEPSKMPGYSYNIPAYFCKTGAKLVKIKSSVCYGCYALKGRYYFDTVKRAMERRFNALDKPQWIEAMIYLINKRKVKQPHFRWHDSGDLQSVNHLVMIATVAKYTPDVTHWLPTREYKMVKDFLAQGNRLPKNLCLRLSAHMVGGKAPAIAGLPTSTVDSGEGFRCPALSQGNSCQDCRACWEPKTKNIDYRKH